MNQESRPIGERDIQAYADGLLDRDPARRIEVEQWLRSRPAEARRCWDYRVRNTLIAERYAGVIEEPVPDRLYRALDARRSAFGLARAAAIAATILTAGGIGWLTGVESASGPSPGLRFAELVSEGTRLSPASHGDAGVTASGQLVGAAGQVHPLGWLSEQITIPLRLPDLSAFGYMPVERRLVGSSGAEAVEVKYAGVDRKPVVLLIAPRWQDESSDIEIVEREGLRIAYGFRGPLGYGVAGEMNEDVIRQVAEAVQRSWNQSAAANAAAAIGMEPSALPVEPVQPLAAHPPSIGGDGTM